MVGTLHLWFTKRITLFTKRITLFTKRITLFTKRITLFTKQITLFTKRITLSGLVLQLLLNKLNEPRYTTDSALLSYQKAAQC